MEDGTVFGLDFNEINLARAHYYTGRDIERGFREEDEYSQILAEELKHGNDDPDDVLDYFQNNYIWEDINNDVFILQHGQPKSYAEMFSHADIEIADG